MNDSHIVPMPKGFLAVRILQIIFALIVAGLTAFLIANTIGFVFSATAFGIFCAIITLIIVTYDLVSEKAAKQAYNMWAVLALDIVMVVFWLAAMGSLAALRAAFTIPLNAKRDLVKRYYEYVWAGNIYLAILAAAAGVAAIELILFIISLIMFSARLHRHRKDRSHAGAEPGVTTFHATPNKIELQQNPGQAYYAPAPTPAHQAYANYPPPPSGMHAQPPNPAVFSPVSPVHTGQTPYQPSMSPPPVQNVYPSPTASPAPQSVLPQQPAPQYQGISPPHGYHEVAGH